MQCIYTFVYIQCYVWRYRCTNAGVYIMESIVNTECLPLECSTLGFIMNPLQWTCQLFIWLVYQVGTLFSGSSQCWVTSRCREVHIFTWLLSIQTECHKPRNQTCSPLNHLHSCAEQFCINLTPGYSHLGRGNLNWENVPRRLTDGLGCAAVSWLMPAIGGPSSLWVDPSWVV